MVDTNVFKLAQPGTFTDSLTEILRSGARALLTQAVEVEVGDFLHRHADLKTEAGRRRLVRHGHLPEREIMTGIGPVAVRWTRGPVKGAAVWSPSGHHSRLPHKGLRFSDHAAAYLGAAAPAL